MAKNDIGGFFVDLVLNPDKNSFETGNKLIDSVTEKYNKLMGTMRNAAVVMATSAVATGAVENANYKTARALGISTDSLNTWKAAAKIAGVNANGLMGSMGKLADVMNHMTIDGRGLEQYAKTLGELGISFEELKDMSPDEAYQAILETAQTKYKGAQNAKEQQEILTKVGDILGPEGENFFIDLIDTGKTLSEFLNAANNTQFTTEADRKKGRELNTEVGILKSELESIAALFGDTIAGTLTDPLKSINNWIQTNGNEIKAVINTIGDVTQALIDLLSPVVGFLFSSLGADVYQISQGLDQIMNGDVKGGVKTMVLGNDFDEAVAQREANGEASWEAKINAGARSIPIYRELVAAADKGLEWLGSKISGKKMKDGIMRPDGTVTQVAPDDWVFAARNIGDLAQAFIPQNFSAGSQQTEITINQTFNIGSSSDMPHVLRQQAYRGAQEGLAEIMSRSSQRMQLMSGTR